ncbi:MULTISPECIES: cache domain-containing sensor histidine kinase [Paenibacillus]|uniref:cache domain-containing sensor histidine kinase n=1 Tax=Paenibacillus TaxID=44249 RepID=UPI0022B8E32C|nr:sensor histidine kinase [Paenibacillus caseinilyticus]MCZ8523900.1 sensor histidine kinase [Paenibacillus caseinilyticus]
MPTPRYSEVKPLFRRYVKGFHSIAVQLYLLFFISILIPVLIGGYLSYQKSARMIEEQVNHVATLTIKQVRDNLDFVFKRLDDTSMRLFSSRTIQEALQAEASEPFELYKKNDEAKQFLYQLIMNMPEIMDIYILDVNRQNSVISSSIQSLTDPWTSEWYRRVVAADGMTVWFGLSNTSYLKGIDMGIPVFGLGRAIKEVDTGRIIGVMFIEVRGKMLTDTLDELRFGRTGYTFLVDEGNRFVYHGDASLYGQPSDLRLPSQTEVLEVKGREQMVIPAVLGNGWKVTGIVPLEELVAGTVEIRDLTVWIALGSGLTALIMGYYVAQRIGRPLVHLSQLMHRGEAGDLTVRSPIQGKNEIGRLSRSFNKMIARIQQLIERIAEEESEKKKAEIRALRYQINPHFLYNTLNTIRWMAKLQRTDDVESTISTLVHILEASLERTGPIVTLGDELQLLEKYMVIQQYRYNNGITLSVQCPPELSGLTMPRMLLQPVVENAIFHGIAPRDDRGAVGITVYRDGGDAVVVIEDDGVGIPAEKLPYLLGGAVGSRTGGMTRIGLSHVHQTLQLYYGKKYGVQVESREGCGTRVHLTFPIQKKEDAYVQSAVG